jgi:DNA mismatch repair ATPase MutS
MNFSSILFKNKELSMRDGRMQGEMPSFFMDLGLDRVINAIITPRNEYDLKQYFFTPLGDIGSILYRHEIMQDIMQSVSIHIQHFSQRMNSVGEHLKKSQKLFYKYQQESWFLDTVEIYCEAIESLHVDLMNARLQSQGFISFSKFLTNYLQSDRFSSLYTQTKNLKNDLSSIRYCVHINGLQVQITHSNGETNYSQEVEKFFARFKENEAKDYLVKYTRQDEMNHVEARILDGVAFLYPEVFSRLDNYYEENRDFINETISLFNREIQFYMAYADYISNISESGLDFCYPVINKTNKEIHAFETFDIALAAKLVEEDKKLVVNDFFLRDNERIIVVSGPNQGGKTTFARAFGQLHYLASLGLPVPGKKAQLLLADKFFTHFENEENIKNLRGKLQDDLIRIHAILQEATSESIVVLNEIFNSTSLSDQIFLGKRIMEELIRLDLSGVWVTFIDELTTFSEQTVSMVSSISTKDPTIRTFKITRNPSNGLVYALSIAEKNRLTYQLLKARLNA